MVCLFDTEKEPGWSLALAEAPLYCYATDSRVGQLTGGKGILWRPPAQLVLLGTATYCVHVFRL